MFDFYKEKRFLFSVLVFMFLCFSSGLIAKLSAQEQKNKNNLPQKTGSKSVSSTNNPDEKAKIKILRQKIDEFCKLSKESCSEYSNLLNYLNSGNFTESFRLNCISIISSQPINSEVLVNCKSILDEGNKLVNTGREKISLEAINENINEISKKLDDFNSKIINNKGEGILNDTIRDVLLLLISFFFFLFIFAFGLIIVRLNNVLIDLNEKVGNPKPRSIYGVIKEIESNLTNLELPPSERINLNNKKDEIENQSDKGVVPLTSVENAKNSFPPQMKIETFPDKTPKSRFSFPCSNVEILNTSNKIYLEKHGATPNYLKNGNTDSLFFLLEDNFEYVKKYYIFPSYKSVSNNSQFNNFKEFYDVRGIISGEIIIEIPAQVRWDESKQGWQLVEKGLMSFRG
jgi:hypothetical protein